MGKAKTGFDGGTIRYKLEAEEDYNILSRRNNEICIEAFLIKTAVLETGCRIQIRVRYFSLYVMTINGEFLRSLNGMMI